MKKAALALVLALAPACKSFPLTLDDDGPHPSAEAAGETAGAIATAVTGNPLIGGAVGTLVGGVAVWLAGRRKPKKPVKK